MKEAEKSIEKLFEERKVSRRRVIGDLVTYSFMASSAGLLPLKYSIERPVSDRFILGRDSDLDTVFYKPSDPLKVNGTSITFVGVSHHPDTFLAKEKDIQERVCSAPFVILEVFGDKEQKKALPSVSKEKLLEKVTLDNSGEIFYSQVGKVCAENRKDIVIVDPYDNNTLFLLVQAYLLGLPMSLAVTDVNNLIAKIRNKPFKRKSFIRSLGYAVGGLAIASRFDVMRDLRGRLEDFEVSISSDKKADKYGLDMIVDYRDVRSAEGVSRLVKMYEKEIGEKEVHFFIGAAHRGIIEYLKDEKLRKTKEIFYNPQKIISENTIRRFHFNREENKWELKEKQVF